MSTTPAFVNGHAPNDHGPGRTLEKLHASPPANGHGPSLPPLLVDAREAARLCGVSPATWWRWDAAGAVPKPVRIGGTTRWKLRDLERWAAWGCPHRAVFEEFVRADDET